MLSNWKNWNRVQVIDANAKLSQWQYSSICATVTKSIVRDFISENQLIHVALIFLIWIYLPFVHWTSAITVANINNNTITTQQKQRHQRRWWRLFRILSSFLFFFPYFARECLQRKISKTGFFLSQIVAIFCSFFHTHVCSVDVMVSLLQSSLNSC